MTEPRDHPFVAAVKPLVDAMGGELMDPAQALPDDVVLSWEGRRCWPYACPSCPIRWTASSPRWSAGDGVPLSQLDRKSKQDVVRMLEARGAFSVRHGVETVAGALGVSRFTVYNYLNRENPNKNNQA